MTTEKFNPCNCAPRLLHKLYLCVPSVSGHPGKLHQMVSEQRAEELLGIGVWHSGHQGLLGHRAHSQNGLHQSKVTVSQQLGVLLPLSAHVPRSDI